MTFFQKQNFKRKYALNRLKESNVQPLPQTLSVFPIESEIRTQIIPPYFLCNLHESVTLLALSPVYLAGLEGKQRKFNGYKDDWIFTEWKPRLCTVKRKRKFCFPIYRNRHKAKFISSKTELCVIWSLSLSSQKWSWQVNYKQNSLLSTDLIDFTHQSMYGDISVFDVLIWSC